MISLRTMSVCLSVCVAAVPLSAQGADDRWGCAADWAEWGVLDDQHYGYDVASGGDWDGDGYDDFLVSSLSKANEPTPDRRVALYLGGDPGAGDLGDLCFEVTGIRADTFGPAVTFLGDVDGGGLDDFAIGAQGETVDPVGYPGLGRVYVYFAEKHAGCPSTVTLGQADVIIEGTTIDGRFGHSVGVVDDFLGNDEPALIVGAPGPPQVDTGVLAGTAFLFSASTLQTFAQAKIDGQALCQGCPGISFTSSDLDADWTASGAAADDRFGYAVSGVGDVDGDGFGDLVVGAIQARHQNALVYETRTSDPGYATLFLGPTGSPVALDPTPATGFVTLLFGHAVAGGQDITDDGRPDILVGAPNYREAGTAEVKGAVFAFRVDTSGVPSPAYGAGNQPVTFDITGTDPELTNTAAFGWDVAMVSDWNDDVIGDWVAGAPGHWEAIEDPAPPPCDSIPDPVADNPQGGRISGRVLVLSGSDPSTPWPPEVLGRYRGEGDDKGRLGTTVAGGLLDDAGAVQPMRDVITAANALTPETPVPPGSEYGRAYVFLRALAGP